MKIFEFTVNLLGRKTSDVNAILCKLISSVASVWGSKTKPLKTCIHAFIYTQGNNCSRTISPIYL